MEIPRSDRLVVFCIEMFGKVVCEVFLPWVPGYIEVTDFYLVRNPEETHFHGAGSLSFDCIVRDGNSSVVVAVYRSRWLWMSQFLENEA